MSDDISLRNRDYALKASEYLETLCGVKPNRRTGSPGNRQATDYVARVIEGLGLRAAAVPFPCLDYACGESSLTCKGRSYDVRISPYSLGCDVCAPLVMVSSVEELENCRAAGNILLLQGSICDEQLMPKNFVFYNPEHHKRIYSLLEEKNPAAIITATARRPELVGALFPFPLIADGDFDIPVAYCTDAEGERISANTGEELGLLIEAERIDSTACNVIARLNPGASRKIVVTAHVDAYEDSPGASDNASGTVVLLLLAEMLLKVECKIGVELAALNGEDHYSAGGQMSYIERHGGEFDSIACAVNIDDVGYVEGDSAYSFYECESGLLDKARSAFGKIDGIVEGPQWFNGDHMIFVQARVPAIAFTSEKTQELMKTITHTPGDTPGILDPRKLVAVASAISNLISLC